MDYNKHTQATAPLLEEKVKMFVNLSRPTKGGKQSYLFEKSIRDAINHKKKISLEDAIDYSVKKAWNDAIIRERMSKDTKIINNSSEIKKILKANLTDDLQIIKNNFDGWHYDLCNENCYGMKYGIWQKFINMTFKYLYCFKDIADIDFSWGKCHCPLDSIIAKKLLNILPQYGLIDKNRLIESIANNGKYGVSWNNITNDDYLAVQNIISYICEKEKICSNLFFDFLYW